MCPYSEDGLRTWHYYLKEGVREDGGTRVSSGRGQSAYSASRGEILGAKVTHQLMWGRHSTCASDFLKIVTVKIR